MCIRDSRSAIPKALKEHSSEASEADKSRRSLTEVRYRDSQSHENVVGRSRRPQSTCSAKVIEAALERSRTSLDSRTKSFEPNRRTEMSEACNEVHARIIVSEARTPPDEERRLTSLGGLRPNVTIDSAEALKTEGDRDPLVKENTRPCSTTLQDNKIWPEKFCCCRSNFVELTPIVSSRPITNTISVLCTFENSFILQSI